MRPARLAPLILGCEGLELGEEERRFFAATMPVGFILFARNIDTPGQLRALTAALREAVGWEAPVFIDQEGGRVDRMGPPHWRSYLPPLEQGGRVAPAQAARAMALRYRLIAHDLRDVGIDGNCAPMGDIARPDTHPVLRNRCYGSDVDTVVRAARGVAGGLLAGGVLPVLKHIPGHGRAVMDSHAALPRVSASAEELRATDFAAFRALADLPLAMSAHIVYEAFSELPATIDPGMIALIREEIGFGGLLMSDDISMQALSGSVAARGAAACAAGCDVILHCNGELAEMQALAGALDSLDARALDRLDGALEQRAAPDTVDVKALEAEYRGLLEGQSADG